MNLTESRLLALRLSLLGALKLHQENLGQLIHLLAVIQDLEESRLQSQKEAALERLNLNLPPSPGR